MRKSLKPIRFYCASIHNFCKQNREKEREGEKNDIGCGDLKYKVFGCILHGLVLVT